MGNYIEQLLERSVQVASTTKDVCDIGAMEKYYSTYNLWLRHSPIPSRPILERAWFEAGILAETSIFLVIHGFYEQACATLRMQLDGFLTRLYWDTLDKRNAIKNTWKDSRLTSNYWEWERGGEEEYPNSHKVWSILLEEEFLQSFDSRYALRADINKHNQLLHKYIHGRPQSRHSPGATRSSVINIRFEEKYFDEWFELFKDTYDLMTIVSVLLYPEYLKHSSWREFILLEPERLDQIRGVGLVISNS